MSQDNITTYIPVPLQDAVSELS